MTVATRVSLEVLLMLFFGRPEVIDRFNFSGDFHDCRLADVYTSN